MTDSPPLKKFRHLSEMIRQRLENEEQNLAIVEVDEIECYMACKATDDDEDPLNYWTKNASIYGKLSPIAQDILSIPASSTPIERIFSVAGYSSSGRRNRLSGKMLETEIMLKTNKVYLPL